MEGLASCDPGAPFSWTLLSRPLLVVGRASRCFPLLRLEEPLDLCPAPGSGVPRIMGICLLACAGHHLPAFRVLDF